MTTTRERMIETTARLLQHRGYHGTSLNDILAASGTPRGSLYFHFPGGKDELVAEATRATVEQATELLRTTLAGSRSPARATRKFFEETARMLEGSNFTFGCPVAPMVLDAPEGTEEIDRLCREAFDEWTELYRQAFMRAGLAPRRAEALALMVESTHEGLMLIVRAHRDVAPMMKAAREVEAAVLAALAGR
jgi:TetR/AcrR family transcriptional regulator, lmrAB and yxaGH operons repressor